MDEKRLTGRVAVVTGASRGIGRATALALAQAGAKVMLVARTARDLETLRQQIEAGGGAACALKADVAEEDQVLRLVAQIRQQSQHVDILVNSAGIGVFGPLLETRVEDWDRVMAVNARGAFLMCREMVPIMPQHEDSCIVNIASVVGVKGYVNQGAYTASKHALMGMTKVLAQELQPWGIRVHALCPGGVATDLAAQARPDLDPSALMTPEEVAEVVLLLVQQTGKAVIDQINLRRASGGPWFD